MRNNQIPNAKHQGDHKPQDFSTWCVRRIGLVLSLGLALSSAVVAPAQNLQNGSVPLAYLWTPLFDGKDLKGWEVNKFAGAGEVKVEDGKIILGSGVALTGLRRTTDLRRSNYEVDVQAMKIQGGDFFWGLTFPVKD
jgi:hypothetical protein